MAQKPRYIDISLAFRANPVTGDIIVLTDEDAVKASVVNLVMTRNYEIPFHPEVGSAVQNSLFDPIGTMTAVNIRRSIFDVLQNFEPRIQVLGVIVSVIPDANAYNAQIIYQIVGQPTTTTINLFLEKTR